MGIDQLTEADTMTPNNDLLRLKQAAAYLQISLPTLWRYGETDPKFPKKIRMSSRCCAYRRSDLDAWLASREV